MGCVGTHDEDGYEVVANDVAKHIGFSETVVGHGAQTDPEDIVDDPQLGVGPHTLSRIGTEVGEFISALVSDDTQTANSNIFQSTRVSETVTERQSNDNDTADGARTRRRPSGPEKSQDHSRL
jgi:hypothetical protein